jgi:hypothetical protein
MPAPTPTTSRTRTLPPDVAQAAMGQRRLLGRFVILSELGRGGMGVVYCAALAGIRWPPR